MKQADVVKKVPSSTAMMVSYLVRGTYKTTNIPLAIEVAKLTGGKPIDYISDKIKTLAIRIYPSLDKKQKNGRKSL